MFTKLRRLYLNNKLVEAEKIIITDKEVTNRLVNVLRMSVGDRIRVFNQTNGEFLANIAALKKGQVTIEIEKLIRRNTDEFSIGLIVPLFKPDRMRWLIEKAVEMRIEEIVFYRSQNTQKYSFQDEKIAKQIISACEQSERISLPAIQFCENIETELVRSEKTTLLCNEREKKYSILGTLPTIKQGMGIRIMIGPEGGFTEGEINQLKEIKDVFSVHLGKTIMRVETAALYSLSVATAYLEEDGYK